MTFQNNSITAEFKCKIFSQKTFPIKKSRFFNSSESQQKSSQYFKNISQEDHTEVCCCICVKRMIEWNLELTTALLL